MASGSGTTGGIEIVLFQGVLNDSRLYFRFTSVLPPLSSRFATLFVSLGYNGVQYLWDVFPVYDKQRAIVGMPVSTGGGGKRIVLRPDVPNLDYSWETVI